MDRRHRVGLQHLGDGRAVGVDHREGQAAGPGIDQLGEPAPGPLRPLSPRRRLPARAHARLLSGGDVLPHRLGIHPQARRHHRLRPAGVPVLQDLNDIDHFEASPCQVSVLAVSGDMRGVTAARSPTGGPSSPPGTREFRERPAREIPERLDPRLGKYLNADKRRAARRSWRSPRRQPLPARSARAGPDGAPLSACVRHPPSAHDRRRSARSRTGSDETPHLPMVRPPTTCPLPDLRLHVCSSAEDHLALNQALR